MRLIHTNTLEIREFFDDEIRESKLEYAILSHCWEKREVSYQEFLEGHVPHDRMKKIKDCCALAQDFGLDWAWVDSCCIDKTSSAELSEAINSMFSWYERSNICFVFLADYNWSIPPTRDRLRSCKWWGRGWTLQELLAPNNMRFYDHGLRSIGSKLELVGEIAAITGIPESLLSGTRELGDFSIAQRMSWASHRKTTRQEDIAVAYCLIGIFDVSMPLLYGEGARSFQRLQETIISRSDDESIFTWLSEKGDERGMLAASPSEFFLTGNIRPIQSARKRPPSTFTSRGLQISYAYPHPALMAFEKLGEAAFGGAVFQSIRRELRLDCELTDRDDLDCWIGISLERDGTSGTWYRRNASKLRIAQQNGYFKHIYPPPVGYERIIARPFMHQQHNAKSADAKRAYSKYSRPLWLAVAYQVAETLVVLSDLWIASAIHHILGIPPPNALVNWAYMTFIWTFTGSDPSQLVVAALFGLCGLDIMTTYPKVNKYLAISGQVAMITLQRFFEHLSWKDLDRNQLVG